MRVNGNGMPVAPGQPSLPFHLMVLKAVPKFGMQRWLRPNAVRALLLMFNARIA